MGMAWLSSQLRDEKEKQVHQAGGEADADYHSFLIYPAEEKLRA